MSAPVNFCRICFRNNNTLRKLHELDIDGVRLSDKLKSCVPEILYTSELEKYESICIECCQFLKTAYMFKELCIRSNILLQGCLIKEEKHPLENLQNLSNHFLDQKADENIQETIVIKEEYNTLPEQFDNTYLSDSEDNSLGVDDSKKSSFQDSNDSSDTSYSVHLQNLIEARKQEDILPNKGKGSFACEFCGRHFTKKTYLNKHMSIHSGERPFVCFLCNMTFNRKNTLDTHMLIHSGIKNYKCHVCGKSFRLKCALDRHLLIHSDYKAYKCKICGKGFGRKDHLEKHGRVHRHLYAELSKLHQKQFIPT